MKNLIIALAICFLALFFYILNSADQSLKHPKNSTKIVEKEKPEKQEKDFFDRCVKQKESGGADPAVAAELCLYLVSEKGKRITGKLISAVWDDWAHMHENIEDLVGSRIYTMRRIV